MSQPENQALRDQLISVSTNFARTHLEKATTAMDELTAYFLSLEEEEEEGPNEQPTDIIVKMRLVCCELTSALQFDNNRGTVSPTGLLRRLRAAARFMTLLLGHMYPTQAIPRISIEYINRPVNPYVKLITTKSPSVRLLKDIAVEHVTEELWCIHDCPICFETISTTATIYTNCHHGFCVTCVKGLVTSIARSAEEKIPTCPMCRAEIKDLKTASLGVFNKVNNHLSML